MSKRRGCSSGTRPSRGSGVPGRSLAIQDKAAVSANVCVCLESGVCAFPGLTFRLSSFNQWLALTALPFPPFLPFSHSFSRAPSLLSPFARILSYAFMQHPPSLSPPPFVSPPLPSRDLLPLPCSLASVSNMRSSLKGHVSAVTLSS